MGEQLLSSIFLAVLGKKYPAEITLLHEDKKCSLNDEPAPDSKMNLDRFCFPNAVEDNDPWSNIKCIFIPLPSINFG